MSSILPCFCRNLLIARLSDKTGNVKARMTWTRFLDWGPFLRRSSSDHWIRLTKEQNAKVWYFLWCQPKQAVPQLVDLPMIRDIFTLMSHDSNRMSEMYPASLYMYSFRMKITLTDSINSSSSCVTQLETCSRSHFAIQPLGIGDRCQNGCIYLHGTYW